MIDIGVNLTSRQFASDLDRVVDGAFELLSAMILTGTDLSDSAAAHELCQIYNGPWPGRLFSTAGVHPHQASQWNLDSDRELRELLALPGVVAVGEAGLDFNRNFSPPDAQIEAFEAQLEIAADLRIPLFLHERDAWQKQREILQMYRDDLPAGGVLHCFTGSREALYSYLDLDLYIGITGWVCDERRGGELADLIADIPADRLLVETDAPYLLPRNIVAEEDSAPLGRRNEPRYLPWVIRKLAQLRDQTEFQVARTTHENAVRLFGLPNLP